MNHSASEPKLPDVLGNQSVTLPAQSFLSDKRKRKKAASLEFESFRERKMHSRGDVARGSNRPTEAVPWINEIVKAKNLGDLSERYSISGATHGDFKTLDSKTISGLTNILHGDFRKRLIEEEKSLATIQGDNIARMVRIARVLLCFVVCVPFLSSLMCCRCCVDLSLFASMDTVTARCAHS